MVFCPACESIVREPPREAFRQSLLYCCVRCDLHFWHPLEMPTQAWHELVYRERDHRVLPLEPGHRFFLADAPRGQGNRLLDIGCGTGNFLIAARSVGYKVTGIELNQSAARFARERLNLNVLSLRLEEYVCQLPEEKFDVVTFFEVLEHQDKPQAFLRLVRSCLKDQGYIVLSVPNRERWRKGQEVLDYPPNHLTRWNARALRNFLDSHGFEVQAIREESVGVRRATEVLNMGLPTGMIRRLAGENPPTLPELAAMLPQEAEASLQRLSRSSKLRIVSQLARLKKYALAPMAFVMLPYLWLRGCKGAYLCSRAKLQAYTERRAHSHRCADWSDAETFCHGSH
jgi:SAM-dependent methyltransferase